jgi:tight adherence protein C
MDESLGSTSSTTARIRSAMKLSIGIPVLFAALGSITLILNATPKVAMNSHIANSKDRGTVQNRLREIGKNSPDSFYDFRSKQLTNSFVVGGAITFALFIFGKSLLTLLLLGTLSTVSTYAYIDRDLSRKVNLHKLRVESEFPAIIEMYSLAMSAGETPIAAMERIGSTATGSLAIEFKKVVTLVKSGKPFHLALDVMGRDLDSIAIRRFVDSLIIATLRGAPIIDVLQRHAQEARELQRNRVLGAAAKAEISMMIPVVFLILPISILFALWPSLANLNLFSSA